MALAARQEDKLREVEKRISDEGGVAISVKTDVIDRRQVITMKGGGGGEGGRGEGECMESCVLTKLCWVLTSAVSST